MNYRNACFCMIAATTLGACAIEESDEGDQLTGEAQAAVTGDREIRLRRLRAVELNENADEMFLTATAAGQSGQNVIRPSGSPDYWLFEYPRPLDMNNHVGTAKADGTVVTVNLWEQDTPPFDSHDRLCRFDVFQSGGFVIFGNTASATHLGVTVDGYHAVRCDDPAQDGVYIVYLDV
jgi:hypothetical protein